MSKGKRGTRTYRYTKSGVRFILVGTKLGGRFVTVKIADPHLRTFERALPGWASCSALVHYLIGSSCKIALKGREWSAMLESALRALSGSIEFLGDEYSAVDSVG